MKGKYEVVTREGIILLGQDTVLPLFAQLSLERQPPSELRLTQSSDECLPSRFAPTLSVTIRIYHEAGSV